MPTNDSTSDRWALFRFAVLGPLMARPPKHGELTSSLRVLAHKTYAHPVTGEPMRIGFSTVEKWWYAVKDHDDPFAVLRRAVRKDAGQQRSMGVQLIEALRLQYSEHPTWSYQLHFDNLEALAKADPGLGSVPSYQTVRRFMKSRGWYRRKRRTDQRAAQGTKEVRSYEHPQRHGLWHLDFHHGKRKVLLPEGRWATPKLMALIDDHSRLCCHAQWYLEEGAEQLIHALCQAIMKRGLPRSIMMDRGSAMKAAETIAGLARLGIHLAYTEVESPYQNGKMETFFAPVEGRLIAMLEGVDPIDLELLNRATVAWVEGEYHRTKHDGIGETPFNRWLHAESVGRPSPSPAELRRAFRRQVTRKQRRSDATCTVDGVRFEVPWQYRHIERLHLRYAQWDMSTVGLVDPRSGDDICALYPLDKNRNATGHRRSVDPTAPLADPPVKSGIAPKLAQLMAEYAATGRPPAYLPTDDEATNNEEP